MRNPLLDRGTPEELARHGQVIEKKEKLENFPRLTEVLAADLSALDAEEVPPRWRQTPVAIRLSFGWGDSRERYPAVEGRVQTRVPAVCQRCLNPVQVALDVRLKSLLRVPGSRAAETEEYEVWDLDEKTLRPLDILDEALVMAMPLSALHDPGRCDPPVVTGVPDDRADTVQPFADLRSQMRENE